MVSSVSLVERLEALVAAFPGQTVLGVGDVMLDQYRRGKAVGISPEAPAIELLNPDLKETPGGAANVAWNIGHLGGAVRLVGVVGRDREGETLRSLLGETPRVSLYLVEDTARKTTLKLRYYHDQFQILRVSHETKEPLGREEEAACEDRVRIQSEECQAIFVEDYGKKVVSSVLVEALLDIRRLRPELPVVFDPKIGNEAVYRSGMCTVFKPNWREACHLAQVQAEGADGSVVARRLGEKFGCDVVITRGADGELVFGRSEQEVRIIPARPREAFDMVGAGDTILAVLTLSLAAGGSLQDAAILANLAGGLVVEKSGTAYVTPRELLAEIQHPAVRAMITETAVPVSARES